MNTTLIAWLAFLGLVLATFSQWVLLRARYLDGLNQQRNRHAEQLHAMNQSFQQAKRQIAQLQLDLGDARGQLARHVMRQSAAVASRAQALRAARPEIPTLRHELPVDGFADTMPSPQYPHDGALLATYPAK
ncbi:MAG: hypothetical protein ABW190_06710 [Rhizobacter sp.]